MLCEFTSILRIKFRLHSRSMRPYNRIALRRKSLRSSFVSWLGHCRFGTFHRGQQFLVSHHTFPEIKKMKRKKLIHRLCMEWKHNLQKIILKIDKLLEFLIFYLQNILWIDNVVLSKNCWKKSCFQERYE